MKRICVVTGSRAEYGILRNLITLLHEDPEIRLELVVTGTHLEEKYGKTILTIKKDEIPIVKEIPMGLRDTTNQTITSGLAKLTAGLGEVFTANHYDLLIILGDRPVTLDSKASAKAQITALLEALQRTDKQCIFIGSNSDTGSDYIREACLAFIAEGDRHYYFPSLETQSYHSLVRYSEGLIGNSSSGLIEVPSLQRPSLNIGDRQKARTSGPSVIHCESTAPAILAGIKKLAAVTVFDNPYEKPSSSYLAYQIITEKLEQGIAKQKPFYDRKEQVI
ncbi:Polysialic acid biosynthesis protein P7 [Listeria grayi]|uniref:Polysialic acid biosynthesis protein P7 n=1 Tax=Listeria grayi TaxID=1641 RepID=A0A378M974_LISGR|nr:UDP-N-acetylglucosamine 2-epimerase [Listeria grayi]STY42918.1 Polysialic acid biosynthesis protein P7 [Listeria grayi]